MSDCKRANEEIKAEIKSRGIKIYEIARQIGCTEQKLYRAMHKPLDERQISAIRNAMDYIEIHRENPDAALF